MANSQTIQYFTLRCHKRLNHFQACDEEKHIKLYFYANIIRRIARRIYIEKSIKSSGRDKDELRIENPSKRRKCEVRKCHGNITNNFPFIKEWNAANTQNMSSITVLTVSNVINSLISLYFQIILHIHILQI